MPGSDRWLLAARISRLRTTYTFTARSFVRFVGQYVVIDRDPALFRQAVRPRNGSFEASALVAYKLNGQSVIFVGYGDDRALTLDNRLVPAGRQVFIKVSYGFQR